MNAPAHIITEKDLHEEALARTRERCRVAVLTMRALPDCHAKHLYHSLASGMPEYLRTDGDYPPAISIKFKPTAEQVTDCFDVFDAFAWYKRSHVTGDRDLKIILWRAIKLPWWVIGQHLNIGRSDRTIQRYYDGAISRIQTKLEGPNVA